MSPLEQLAEWSVRAAGISPGSHLYESMVFFLADTIKIFLLLAVIVFFVSYLRSYVPPQKIRGFLANKPPVLGSMLAALFGIITPFCTCSAIPLFLGFIQAGVPLGATFSFLVSSPMVNEVALIMLFGMFGWKIAMLYAASGVIIAILSGLALGKMKVEHLLEDFVTQNAHPVTDYKASSMNQKKRAKQAWRYTVDIINKIWPYLLVGIGLGALIHGYVPADFMARYASADKWYAVPFATLLGIPLYSNAAGVVPLIKVLSDKGVATGTILAFMMAVTALSLPEFMILKKIMKPKLIAIYAGAVGLGIMFTGYLFNIIL